MTDGFEQQLKAAIERTTSSPAVPSYEQAWQRGRRRRFAKRAAISGVAASCLAVALTVNLGPFGQSQRSDEVADSASAVPTAEVLFEGDLADAGADPAAGGIEPVPIPTADDDQTPAAVPSAAPSTQASSQNDTAVPAPTSTTIPAPTPVPAASTVPAQADPPVATATPEPTPTATASADPTAVPPPTATSAAASGDAASSLPVTPDPSSEAIPTPTATQQVDPGTDAATQSDDGQDNSSQGDSSQGDVEQRETEPSDPNPDDPLQDETDPGQGEQPDPDDAGSVANDTQDPQEPLAEQPGDGEPVDPAIAAATGPVATTTAVDATVSQPTGLDDQPCTTGDGVTAATCDLLPPYSCVAVADARFGYQAIDVDGDGQVETCVALPVTTCDTTGDGVGDTPCTIEISGDEQGSGGENLGPDG